MLNLKRTDDGGVIVGGDDADAAAYIDNLLLAEEEKRSIFSGVAKSESLASRMETRREIISQRDAQDRHWHEENFRNFLRLGREALDERAQSVGVDASGGYLTPASFAASFADSLKSHDELFEIATLVETDKGTDCKFPVDDNTSAVATVVAESGTSLLSSPVVFDQVAFGRAPMWRSGHIVCPYELVNDSRFDLPTLLARNFGRRFARGVGASFISTLLTDADTGVTTAASGAVTGDEILDLVASVDSAIAMRGAFLLNTSTLTALRKLKASTGGAYLLPFGRNVAGRKTLFDFPIYESPSMPNLGSGAKAIAFGSLDSFVRRQVRGGPVMKTYVERYATANQIAYEAFLRCDGKLMKAASAPMPIRLLVCHS